MKKYKIVVLCLVVVINLVACTNKVTSDDKSNENISSNKVVTDVLTESKQEEKEVETNETPPIEEKEVESNETPPITVESDIDKEAMNEAYTAILKNLYYDYTFPDGYVRLLDETTDMSQNQFAVYDIDGDGKEELIIQYTTDIMAGMVELIYDFDVQSQTAKEEFREFPGLHYYDNGMISADWSHNQGLAGDFWPYTLYQYDSTLDTYVSVGMVDAWDRSLSEKNFNGDDFPTETDIDGDGMVYYIMEDGTYELNKPVDKAEYEQWLNSYLNDAKEIEVPYKSLNEENITSISIVN